MSGSVAIKRFVKRGLYTVLRAGGFVRRRLDQEAVRGRLPAHILVYHRVLPECDPADDLTVRLDAFRREMEMLRRVFSVIRLGEMIDRVVTGEPFPRPLVSITFDDGYEDNHRWAARVLEELGLPACFFVTAGYMGTERVFPWDAEAKVRHPLMTWEQVRELAAAGFEIGAHTVSHLDLGQASPDEARRELAGSREMIAAAIGREPDLFAYPFGGPDNFRPELARVVQEEGFRCSLSAFGGVVWPGGDPYRLQRLPVSPYFGRPVDLRMEMERIFSRGLFAWRNRGAD